jgi:hypothetical protein
VDQSANVGYTEGDLRRIRRWLGRVDRQVEDLGLSPEDTEEVRQEVGILLEPGRGMSFAIWGPWARIGV